MTSRAHELPYTEDDWRELVVRLGVREANVYFDAFVPTGAAEPGAARADLRTR